MKTYSRNKLRFKRLSSFFLALCIILLILGIILLICFCFKENIEVVRSSSGAVNVSDDVAANSEPIIIDNLVVGGLYDKTWVSANKYYLKSNKKSDVTTYVYNKDTRAGEYKVKEIYAVEDASYAKISYPNYIDEYFATPSESYALTSQFIESEVEERDYDFVKKALGIYRLYNSSMNITNVYNGYIDLNTPIRIICVTSSKKGPFDGVYSAIIVTELNSTKSKILQYSYTKNLVENYEFPIHSIEFMADLNGDSKAEIITRGISEFKATYNIFEYQNGKFVKVLSEVMKAK